MYVVAGVNSGMVIEGVLMPCTPVVPSLNTPNQRFGPFSLDWKASDTCVGPTSVRLTTGLVGGMLSAGNRTVTALL